MEKRIIEDSRLEARTDGTETSARLDVGEGTTPEEDDEEVNERLYLWVPLVDMPGYMMKFYVDD